MPEPQVYGFVDPATGQVHVADTQAEVLAYQAKGWTLGASLLPNWYPKLHYSTCRSLALT